MARDETFEIGEWTVIPSQNRLRRGDETRELEPRVMALLTVLAEAAGDVAPKAQLRARLWPGVTVNDEALARLVWKLRKAFDDPARSPRYVETVPKKGYRLALPVGRDDAGAPASGKGFDLQLAIMAALILATLAGVFVFGFRQTPPAPALTSHDAGALIRRADGFYYQMTRAGNEAARRLYEDALRLDPQSPAALAGLSNVITQSVIRWGETPGDFEPMASKVREAIESGRTATPEARAQLDRALGLVEAAIAADADFPLAWRALGLVQSARGDIEAAIESYERAVTLDPDAWEALINLSDMESWRGRHDVALTYSELAWEAMSRVYDRQAELVRPWHSLQGIQIAQSHVEAGAPAQAELWYRRVLNWDPLNADAANGLAALLLAAGDRASAVEVCADARAECAALSGPR